MAEVDDPRASRSGYVGSHLGYAVALHQNVLVGEYASAADVDQFPGFDENRSLGRGSLLAAALGEHRGEGQEDAYEATVTHSSPF